jgi:curved DNA-binding protein CbpA
MRNDIKTTMPTHYEVLSLSQAAVSSADDPAGLIKRAYRRALLSHHPDKTNKHHQNTTSTATATATAPSTRPTFTIDQISTAYATLSRPSQRAAYDQSLLLGNTDNGTTTNQGHHSQSENQSHHRQDFQTGIETVDLDDLAYFEEDHDSKRGDQEAEEGGGGRGGGGRGGGGRGGGGGVGWWYRACRCGNPRGYLFSTDDLEEAADVGELMIGCADCSLWLRVHFAVVEEEDEGNEGGGSGGDQQQQQQQDVGNENGNGNGTGGC